MDSRQTDDKYKMITMQLLVILLKISFSKKHLTHILTEFTNFFGSSKLKFRVCIINRSINFCIMIKVEVRGAFYTQGHIIFEV